MYKPALFFTDGVLHRFGAKATEELVQIFNLVPTRAIFLKERGNQIKIAPPVNNWLITTRNMHAIPV